MRKMLVIAAAVVLVSAGCGGEKSAESTPSAAPVTVTATPSTVATVDAVKAAAACRDALRADYETGWAKKGNDPYPPAARGPACSVLTRPTIERLMEEAIDDLMNGTTGPG